MNLKDVFDKLTSYNLFNYLFPGFVFVLVLSQTTELMSPELDFNLGMIVIIYFTGLVISRIGSLILEDMSKVIFFVSIGNIDMQELLEKLKGNVKFEAIFEAMNMYRTLSATLFCLGLFTIVDTIMNFSDLIISLVDFLGEIGLGILFFYAYRKQRRKVLLCLKHPVNNTADLFKWKKKDKRGNHDLQHD